MHPLGPQQSYVNQLLNRAVVFSIIWVFGFGSAYALYLTIKAHRVISDSHGAAKAPLRLAWCYVVGGLGVAFLVGVTVSAIVNQ